MTHSFIQQSFSLPKEKKGTKTALHSKSLNLVAEGANLGVEVRGLVRGEGNGNDSPRDTAGTALDTDISMPPDSEMGISKRTYQRNLAGNIDVGGILLLRDKGNVEDDTQGLGVGSEDNQLGGATVDRFGSLVLITAKLAYCSSCI